MALPQHLDADMRRRWEQIFGPVRAAGLPGCAHTGQSGELVLCAAHPTRFRCPHCALRHMQGHPVDVENTCDLCGRLARELYGALTMFETRARVRPDRGRPMKLRARITLVTVGYCPACFSGEAA